MQLPETVCARARESVSAHLDGELSARELDHLEAHLVVCPACAAWAAQVRDVTYRLREARLETPLERFILPRLRRSWKVGSAVALVSAAAVVATMFFAPGRGSQDAVPRVTGFVGVAGQQFVVSRLGRLEDGVYSPVASSTADAGFRHV